MIPPSKPSRLQDVREQSPPSRPVLVPVSNSVRGLSYKLVHAFTTETNIFSLKPDAEYVSKPVSYNVFSWATILFQYHAEDVVASWPKAVSKTLSRDSTSYLVGFIIIHLMTELIGTQLALQRCQLHRSTRLDYSMIVSKRSHF